MRVFWRAEHVGNVAHPARLSLFLGELENIDFLGKVGDALFILTACPHVDPCIFRQKAVMKVIATFFLNHFLACFWLFARCCSAHLCEPSFSKK